MSRRVDPTLSKKERIHVQEVITYIDNTVKMKKVNVLSFNYYFSLPPSLSLSLSQSSLYKDYLSQSVSGIDMLHEKY